MNAFKNGSNGHLLAVVSRSRSNVRNPRCQLCRHVSESNYTHVHIFPIMFMFMLLCSFILMASDPVSVTAKHNLFGLHFICEFFLLCAFFSYYIHVFLLLMVCLICTCANIPSLWLPMIQSASANTLSLGYISYASSFESNGSKLFQMPRDFKSMPLRRRRKKKKE